MAASKELMRTQLLPFKSNFDGKSERLARGGRVWELVHIAGPRKCICQADRSVRLKGTLVSQQLAPAGWSAWPNQQWHSQRACTAHAGSSPKAPSKNQNKAPSKEPKASLGEEANGAVVFRRQGKKNLQYATSLEHLDLGRLSSPQAQEAALGMGIEKAGEHETPVCVGFTVVREGRGDLRLEGAVDTAIDVPCARCACPVGVPIEGAFNLLLTLEPLRPVGRTVVGIVQGRKSQGVDHLEKAERQAGGQEDAAYDLDLDDKKHFSPEDTEIDLTGYIRETILLKIPTKVLCHEGCKGLCFDCGADWNKESCSCAEARIQAEKESPSTALGQALAQLRVQLEERKE